MFARWRRLLSGQHRLVWAACGSTVVSSLVTVAWPILVGRGINQATAGHRGALQHVAIELAVVVAVKPVAEWLRVAWTIRLGERVLGNLRTAAFERVMSLPLLSLEQRGTGAVVSRLTTDLELLTLVVGRGSTDILFGAVLLVVAAVGLLVTSPFLALASLAAAPVIVVSVRRYLRDVGPANQDLRTNIDIALGRVQRDLTAHRVIQAAGRENDYFEQYRVLSAAVAEATAQVSRHTSRLTAGFPMAYGLALLSVLAASELLRPIIVISAGSVSSCVLILAALWVPASSLLDSMTQFQGAGVAFRRVNTLVELDERLPEPKMPGELSSRGSLHIRAVQFAYQPGVPVLGPIDLVIPAGQHLAIVGATGSGKSALAGLIARSYDPDVGAITLGGIDLRDVAVAEVRRAVMLVAQDSHLFSGTVAENVALANAIARIADVEAALESIGAMAMFERLPMGVRTPVGATSLSVGERQLIALGRVAMNNPAVVILDEATAYLDPQTEHVVDGAVRRLGKGRTLITIVHRLGTTWSADRVVVLEGGKVVEDGQPQELLDAGGYYARLWSTWTQS
jgi:ATP-binding cassette, subfamily B, bacterial